MLGSVMTGGTAVALAAALLSPGTAVEERPPPGSVAVELRTVNGSGCGVRTSLAVAPDYAGFTTSYESSPARVGVGSRPGEARRICQLALDVQFPRGFTYAITGTEHTGYARLAKGATGQLTVRHYVQAVPSWPTRTHRFTGPYDDVWETADFDDVGTAEYAPCGERRLLTLSTELRVDAGTSDPATTTSELGLNDTGSDTLARYRLAWKRCPAV
ncbi:DUF4360 domain-containing protein [Streptomyces luteireticuli]|uniref:DUF4360 domain-containing protein n=1 Tax=Streptomyces luteireticuli TaxID=173858 RepID=UPI003558793C